MIRPEDIEFHPPPEPDHRYAETNFFCFTIPEQRLMVSAYTVSRPSVGAMAADVIVFGDLVSDRAECLYIDSQQHLPLPARLSDYRTPSGLVVKAKDPRSYHVEYSGYDGLRFSVDFEGLMEPFDIHDPEHSPKAKAHASTAEKHAGSGLGSGYGGHFDLTCRVRGELQLGGKLYAVDCVETMDHSWGTRPELGLPAMGWMHAHFGPDLAIHWIAARDPAQPGDRQWTLAHGYVLQNGKVYGLTDMTMRSVHAGRVLSAMQIEVTDVRGQRFRLEGSSVIGAPWTCFVCTEAYCAMVRWTLPDGRIGHGMCQQNESMQSLNRRIGKRAILAS